MMACVRQFLRFLLNNSVTLLILYSLLRYYYSDLIPPSQWTPLQTSTADHKSGMAFPSIQEVEGKWVMDCGRRFNESPVPS
jgi:hypothetical protein